MSCKQQRGRPKRKENVSTLRIEEPTKKKWDEFKQASQFGTHNEFAQHLLELHARSDVESMPSTDNRLHEGKSLSEEQFETDLSVHTTIPLSSTSDIHQGQEVYGVPTVPTVPLSSTSDIHQGQEVYGVPTVPTIPLSSTSDIHQGQEVYGVPTVPTIPLSLTSDIHQGQEVYGVPTVPTVPLSLTSDIHQDQETYGVPTVPDSDQKFRVIYQNGNIFSKQYIQVGFDHGDHDLTILLKKSVGGIGYGKYSLCQLYIGNEMYVAALKLIKLTKENREVTWNKTLNNQHIFQPEFILERNDCLVQIMQTISLRQYIIKLLDKHKEESGCEEVYHFDCHGSMIVPEMLRLLANIISGVATLQKHGLFQSHINTDTIILTGDGCVMIALDESIYGVPGFTPPEVYEDKTDSKSILFSLGCCIAEIAGLCSMVVDPIGKTREQITAEVLNRNNEMGFLMNNSSRLVTYGISNMFVMSTKLNVEERGSIDELLIINNAALLQMRQQLSTDTTYAFQPTRNYTHTQPSSETYDLCHDADMLPQEQGSSFTLEQILPFANWQPYLPTNTFTEQQLSAYTCMLPQLKLQPIVVTCMQKIQAHETYKHQQPVTETYMDTQSTMETETLSQHTVEIDKLPHHTMEPDKLPQHTIEPDNLSHHTMETDKLPQQTMETDKLPHHTMETDKLPQQTMEPDKLPHHTMEPDKLPHQPTENTYIKSQQQIENETTTMDAQMIRDYLEQQYPIYAWFTDSLKEPD